MQTIPILVLDGVLLVVEDRVQSFVKMGNVISAVEDVIDEDFPIAMDVVGTAIEVMQFADAKWRDTLHNAPEEFVQRSSVRIEVDEDEALPGFDANRKQAVLGALEVLHAFKFRHTF